MPLQVIQFLVHMDRQKFTPYYNSIFNPVKICIIYILIQSKNLYLFMKMDKNSSSTKTRPTKEQDILSSFSFDYTSRKFKLHKPAWSTLFTDLQIGSKVPAPNNTQTWVCGYEEFVYFLSMTGVDKQVIMYAYTNMNAYEIAKTKFYLKMRNAHAVLKIITPSVYGFYKSQEAYNQNEEEFRIKIFQADCPLQSVNWTELNQQCTKIAIVKVSDSTFIDIFL